MADLQAKRVINGTYGEVWLDSDKVAECYGLQAKIEFKKEAIQLPRQLAEDSKVVGWSGKGTLKLHKVNSRMARALVELVKNGKEARFTVISKLADPDSYGAERISVTNVSFDDLTLADWEAATPGKVETPFTFTGYEFLDEIVPE